MSQKYTAILLKKVNYGDKKLILQTYTKEAGSKGFFLQTLRAKGKSKINLPPLCILDLVAERRKGDLLYVKEINLKEKHFDLLEDLRKSSVVMFLNEVLIKTIREYDTDEELFEFITNALEVLDRNQLNEANFHLKFLLELSKHLGFYPNGQFSENNAFFDLYEGHFSGQPPLHKAVIGPGLCFLFADLLKCRVEDSSEVKLSKSERRDLLSHLIDYYRIHIENFDELKSKEILETVFS